METVHEIDNPQVGDSVTSECGTVKVTVKEDGTIPVTKLTTHKGSFNILLYYQGKTDPDTVVFKTDDQPVIPHRLDSGKALARIKSVENPVSAV